MIDNYDSFTFNLVDYFRSLGQDVLVKRNDEITIDEIKQLQPDYIVLSPGPCSPNESGICISVVEQFTGQIPILGVCLGFQVIAQVFGNSVVRSKHIMHGKTSKLQHKGIGMFKALPSPITVTRYHSLCVDYGNLSSEFEITAWVEGEKDLVSERELMGFKHKTLALEGVQFHPESVLTEHGHEMLNNFLLDYSKCNDQ